MGLPQIPGNKISIFRVEILIIRACSDVITAENTKLLVLLQLLYLRISTVGNRKLQECCSIEKHTKLSLTSVMERGEGQRFYVNWKHLFLQERSCTESCWREHAHSLRYTMDSVQQRNTKGLTSLQTNHFSSLQVKFSTGLFHSVFPSAAS